MQYYRCKCGESVAFGSMPPQDCEGCVECNTTLEQHPDNHKPLAEHEWIDKFDQNTGEKYQRCIKCLTRKKDEL